MGHATLSPSAAERWMTCPGSAAACADYPDTTSPYADEGTAAHAVLESTLKRRFNVFGSPRMTAHDAVGERINVADEGSEPRLVSVTDDMAEHVQTVVDYVANRVVEMKAKGPVVVVPERKVSPAWALGTEDCSGTADIILVSDAEIEVIDLKFGRGVVVEPGNRERPNPQMGLYALGALGEWTLRPGQTVALTVAQPRAPHPDGPIRSLAGLDAADLQQFTTRVRLAIEATRGTDAPRVASEHGCRFCKAKRECRAWSEFASASIGAPTSWDKDAFLAEATAFTTQRPATLTPTEVVRILQSADLFRGFLGAMEDWAHEALTKGTAPAELLAAYKLVHGRAQRRWMEANDASIAAALLKIRWKDPATEKSTGLGKKDIYNEALKSPTQVEALLKAAARGGGITPTHWEAYTRLVEKPEGKLQLAPITDPRPAAGTKDPATMFAATTTAAPPTVSTSE